MGAVDAIRKAGNRIIFTIERKVLKLSQPKVFTLPIKREDESGSTLRTSSPSPQNSPLPKAEEQEQRPDSAQGPSPSPNLVFPCPRPYKGFDSMIPSENKAASAVVTVTVKHPDTVSKPVPELFPPTPTDLGTVTETITKSTLTETVFTRVTHNEAIMIPVQTEV
jgi:protein scribble